MQPNPRAIGARVTGLKDALNIDSVDRTPVIFDMNVYMTAVVMRSNTNVLRGSSASIFTETLNSTLKQHNIAPNRECGWSADDFNLL